MPNKPEYLSFVTDWLAPLGEISTRSMFGGHALYCDGAVFALVADNNLFLKADEVTRPRFEALGLEAFRPFPDKPGSMQYYSPPPEFFEDGDAMKAWGSPAIEAAQRAAAKKKGSPGGAAKVARRKG